MNDLEFRIKKLFLEHRGARSHATVARRVQEGRQMARQLHKAGFKLDDVSQLRGKSVNLLVDIWRGDRADPTTGQVRALSPSTMAVRMSTLRELCRFGGKPTLISPSNAKAGLPQRDRQPKENRAWRLTPEQLERVDGQCNKLSVQLQEQFGLRRKEALLMDARTQHQGDILVVERGTKGGRRREVLVTTDEQRALLEEVKRANGTTPGGTLVAHATLKVSYSDYGHALDHAGIKNGHGLRHQYAQDRYAVLVARIIEDRGLGTQPWASPKGGGPAREELSRADREIDLEARELLTRELGHGRVTVTTVYIG